MNGCCSFMSPKEIHEKVNVDLRETDTGFVAEVTPKDPSQAEALKGLARGIQAFCCPHGGHGPQR